MSSDARQQAGKPAITGDSLLRNQVASGRGARWVSFRVPRTIIVFVWERVTAWRRLVSAFRCGMSLQRTFSTKADEKKKETKLEVAKGMNRLQWDLSFKAPDIPKITERRSGAVDLHIGWTLRSTVVLYF